MIIRHVFVSWVDIHATAHARGGATGLSTKKGFKGQTDRQTGKQTEKIMNYETSLLNERFFVENSILRLSQASVNGYL